MSSSPAHRVTRLVAGMVVAASWLYTWTGNRADEDLWNHLHFGDVVLRAHRVPLVDRWSYSAAGAPFFDHQWGADVVLALLFRGGGAVGLFALKLGLAAVILWAIVDAARTLAAAAGLDGAIHPVSWASALVLALAAMAPGASFRPQLFTMTCLALVGVLFERAERALSGPGSVPWVLAGLPLVLVLWANTHGGVALGLGLVGVFATVLALRAVLAWSRHEPGPRGVAVASAVALAATAMAATTVNPYGLGLHRYLAHTLELHDRIAEWHAVPLWSTDHLPFKALVVVTLTALVWWWRTRPTWSARLDWRIVALAIAAAAALRHQRHTVLFAIMATPLVTVAVETLRRRVVTVPSLAVRRPVAVAIAAGALAVAGVQLADVAGRFARDGLTIRYARTEFPADAVAYMHRQHLGGNLAVQFEWGGYALEHLGDRVRVFIDGRYEAVYPAAVIADYDAFIDAAAGWERVLDAYPTDGVLIDRASAVVARLDARADFARVYTDATSVLYLRRPVPDVPTTTARRAPEENDTVFP